MNKYEVGTKVRSRYITDTTIIEGTIKEQQTAILTLYPVQGYVLDVTRIVANPFNMEFITGKGAIAFVLHPEILEIV